MKWFNNLKIKSKLLGGFLFVSLLTAVVGYQGLSNMSTINDMLNSLYNNETMGIAYIKEANIDLIYFGRAQNNFLLSSSVSEREKYADMMKTYEELLLKNINSAKPLVTSDKGKELISSFLTEWNNYKVIVDKILSIGTSEDLAKVRQSVELARTSGRQKADKIDTLLSQLSRLKESAGKQFYTQSDDVYAQARMYMIILILGAMGFGIVIGYYISRLISKPLIKTVSMIQELGKGHLSERLNLKNSDETGAMANALDQFADDLQQYVIGSMQRIADGDVEFEVPAKDSGDEISPALNKTTSSLRSLKDEISSLRKAAEAGELDKKGNSDKFKGAYKDIINGFNDTIQEIVERVRETESIMEQLSSGDLTARMVGDYKGNYKRLQSYTNNLGESLHRIIQEVRDAVSATASASSEISSSTEEMAAGSEEQSQQTSEVAGAIEEMTKTILENTQNASQANEASKNAGNIAKEGGKIVSATIDGMTRIAEVVKRSAQTVQQLGKSSEEIGNIIQVIDDIADQTNLLALNAAIEAARAGEQGRGFAVVADEVRKLAERTTKATKEIASMIRQIQNDTQGAVSSMKEGTQEVEAGKSLADQAGDSLRQIIEGADNVVSIITQVAAASEEQSSASEQISKNIEAISSVTEQSTAGVQQIAKAAGDLNRLTNNLENLVGKFKIKDNSLSDKGKNFKSDGESYVRSNGKIVEYA